MRRSNASRAIVNRRRVRRRRKAIPAQRLSARPLWARLRRDLAARTGQLQAAIAPLRAKFTGRAAEVFSILRHAIVTGYERACSGYSRARYAGGVFGEFFLTTLLVLRRDLTAIRDSLRPRLARIWAVANKEVDLPQINFAPFFRVSGVLAVSAAVGVAGFAAWHAIPANRTTDKPLFVAARDHHPPLAVVVAAEPAVPIIAAAPDAESEFPGTYFGQEEDLAPPPRRDVAAIPDIDAGQDYGVITDFGPEEDEVAALSMPPRARMRPDIPPLAAPPGIPMQPEPPMGYAPAQPAWLANAVEPGQGGQGPMIAIVIDDAGVVQTRTKRASELPAPITIAFIPYSDNLERQARYARSRGHELLLHIPMEPGGGDSDPGYNALLTTLGQDEIMRRFRWALDRFDGYVGVNNHMGSKFMARGDLVRPVLEEINARGLLFLDSRTDHKTVGTRLARDMGMPNATRNVFLDNDLDATKIEAQLAELERVARRRGSAIAIGHPHDVTVEVLAKWIPEARRKGFELVPVSTIVKKEYGPRLAAAAAGGEADGLLGGAQ